MQETLLHAIRHVRRFEPRRDGAFQAYLRQALRNRIRDAIRKAKRGRRLVSLPSGWPDDRPSPFQAAVGREAYERYEAGLARLPAIYREAIIARIELHQSWDEVAKVIDKPSRNAARMIVTRALRRIAQEMARD